MNEIDFAAERHKVGGRLNNRAENSHQPVPAPRTGDAAVSKPEDAACGCYVFRLAGVPGPIRPTISQISSRKRVFSAGLVPVCRYCGIPAYHMSGSLTRCTTRSRSWQAAGSSAGHPTPP
jgi:hypothetical protein